LPTYPFQRQRFWLDNLPPETSVSHGVLDRHGSVDRHGSKRASAEDMQKAFFELQWQPRSRWNQQLPRSAPGLLSPEQIASAAQSHVERLRTQLATPRYAQFDVQLDRLSAAYVREAMKKLGWCPRPGECFDEGDLAVSLGLTDAHRRLWSRLLQMLAEDGVILSEGDKWQVTDQIAVDADPSELCDDLASQFPECDAELTLLSQCGTALADVLAGRADSLEVLFPSGSSAMVERLYRDSPFARTLNALIEESIAKSIGHIPADHPLKILEIGAGTGGTTAQLLHRLPADRTEYLFTDVSELFTRAATDRFSDFPFVRYGMLDIEIDPRSQGYADHQFDVVLAANVLHATKDLSETLRHIQQLLVPGGILVVAETTRRQRWLDLIFGLTDGWWRFTDVALRPDHPLLSPHQWTSLFAQTGFDSAVALPESLAAHSSAETTAHSSAETTAHSSTETTAHSSTETPPHTVLIAQTASSPTAKNAGHQLTETTNVQDVRPWLLLADRQGVGDRLAADLERGGHRCIRVYAAQQFRRISDSRFEVNPIRGEDLAKIFDIARMSTEGSALQGVLHLWSLDAEGQLPLTYERLEQSQIRGAASVPALLRAMQQTGDIQLQTWFVTRGAQPVQGEMSAAGLAQSPLIGLARVMSQELPASWGGLIDLDLNDDVELAARQVVEEVLRPDTEDQVAYRNGQRFAARLERQWCRPSRDQLRCHADGSYLITGGLGDLGLKVAGWLVDRGARNLVLTSRSALASTSASDDPRQAAIGALEARGVSVQVRSVDVADEAGMETLLNRRVHDGWPPLRGVVHCAGVAEALPLLELDQQQMLPAFRAKVFGTWVVHRVTAGMPLDFFVNFSSGATLLGSPLLGSYAAANAFLDAIAHFRHSLGQTTLTANWGFWDEVGMVNRSQKEIGRGFAPRGMQSFSPEQGLRALEELLLAGVTQSAVMPVNWQQWCKFHPTAGQSPLLRNVLRRQEDAGDAEGTKTKPGEDRDRILAAAPADRLSLLEKHLCGQLGRVLRIPADELDTTQPLINLGIDSLMAVEFRNHVELQLQASIPVAQLLQGPTIRQVAETLLGQLTDNSHVPPLTSGLLTPGLSLLANGSDTPDAPSEGFKAHEVLGRLDELSDSQIDSMLGQMLDER